ncbi:MAG: hypothetical protein IKE27_12135 [Oscillospiraceae bacterium]|nr:hypothetical protein [Oscillospiraceae bacterium]
MSKDRKRSRLNLSIEEFRKEDLIFNNNPVFVSGLGLAALITAVDSVRSAFIISVAVFIMSIITRIIGNIVCKYIPERLWIMSYALIACMAYIPSLLVLERMYSLNAIRIAVGIYLPMLVADSMVISRAEIPLRETFMQSTVFGLRSAVGFTIAAFLVGSVREVLGKGTFIGTPAVIHGNLKIFLTVCGGFITLSLLSALWQRLISISKSFSARGGDDK